MQAFESGTLDVPNFYFTGDDYRYRFESDAKQRFIDLIRERFNAGVKYRGLNLKWDTVIEQKANELGRFLAGKSSTLDFIEPAPNLERQGNHELRAKILGMTAAQARQLGIGKSTLHYMRKNAANGRSFRIYSKVYERFNSNQAVKS